MLPPIAVHEASHATVGLSLACRLDGGVHVRPQPGCWLGAPAGASGLAGVLPMAVAYLAGAEGERTILGEHTAGDAADVKGLGRLLARQLPPGRWRGVLDRAARLAREAVAAHEDGIRRVAAALAERGRLSGMDVYKLAGIGRGWGLMLSDGRDGPDPDGDLALACRRVLRRARLESADEYGERVW